MSVKEAQAMVHRLADHLESKHGIHLSRDDVREALAAVHGYKSWGALMGALDRTPRPVIVRPPHMQDAAYVLGTGPAGPAVVTHRDMSGNLLLCGQAHAGLPLLQRDLLRQQIYKGGGLIFLGSAHNEELSGFLAREFARAGRAGEFQAINFDGHDMAVGLNPLTAATPEEVAQLVLSTHASEALRTNSALSQAFENVVHTLTLALRTATWPVTFRALLELLQDGEARQRLLVQLQTHPAAEPLRALCTRLAMRDGLTLTAQVFLLSALQPFTSGVPGDLLNEREHSLALGDILAAKQGLYISLPGMAKPGWNLAVGRLVLQHLADEVVRHQGAKSFDEEAAPFLVALENSAAYWTRFANPLLITGRRPGVGCLVVQPSLAQGGDMTYQQALMDYTWNKVFFRQAGAEDERTASVFLSCHTAPEASLLKREGAARPSHDLLKLPWGQAVVAQGPAVFSTQLLPTI